MCACLSQRSLPHEWRSVGPHTGNQCPHLKTGWDAGIRTTTTLKEMVMDNLAGHAWAVDA